MPTPPQNLVTFRHPYQHIPDLVLTTAGLSTSSVITISDAPLIAAGATHVVIRSVGFYDDGNVIETLRCAISQGGVLQPGSWSTGTGTVVTLNHVVNYRNGILLPLSGGDITVTFTYDSVADVTAWVAAHWVN